MAGALPTPAFAAATLDLAYIAPGAVFGRVYRQAFPDPLGFGKTRSRFSDPRRRAEANRFGVLYLGSSLTVCFVEAVLRDASSAVGRECGHARRDTEQGGEDLHGGLPQLLGCA